MRPLIGTNWKMNLTSVQADDWLRTFLPLVASLDDRDLFVLPPFTSLCAVRDRLRDTQVAWGGQDVHPLDAGPYTGDISAPMLADLGCRYVMVGHAERRRQHAETPELISAKAAAILRWGMRPIVCIGEPARGTTAKTLEFLIDDLARCLAGIEAADLARAVIAYEPHWAMGEGSSPAAPQEVGLVHRGLSDWLEERGGGAALPIIYGGSVDVASAAAMLAEPAIAGLFVGRYALDPVNFARIAGTVWSGGEA
jgi:triosephosphate isomerase